MGYPHKGSQKFFWNSGLAPIDFSCPKTPEYQKSANLEKKIFFSRSVLGMHHPLFKMVITRQFISNLSNSFFKSCSMDHKLQFYFSFFVSFLWVNFFIVLDMVWSFHPSRLFQAAISLCQLLFFDHFWYSGIFGYGELKSDEIIKFWLQGVPLLREGERYKRPSWVFFKNFSNLADFVLWGVFWHGELESEGVFWFWPREGTPYEVKTPKRGVFTSYGVPHCKLYFDHIPEV